MRRVVVTGVGAVTPLGLSFRRTWEAMKEGVSGISRCSRVRVDDIPWKVAGEIKGSPPFVSQREMNRLDPFIQYALSSAVSAVEDASVSPGADTMVIIGSSRGGITRIEDSLKASLGEGRPLSAYLMPSTTIGMAPSYIAQRLRLRGYCLGVSNACASGTVAVGEAYRLIRDGYADAALAGGAEAPLCRLCLEGYGRTGALSRGTDATASRPFDRARDGFVLSEGACILMLEEMEAALGRGATVYAEIAGYASINEGTHQTAPSETGEVETIRLAIRDAGLSPEDIGMVNAHGTSTVQGDRTEARALREVFGGRAVMVTANKSMTGHMLAASGALEVAATAVGLHEGVVPPTVNVSDPECDLNLSGTLLRVKVDAALSCSFGFGGIHAAVVLKRAGS